MLLTITSLLFAIIGLVIGGGGVWLLLLGGSWFYAFAGLMFLLTAFFLWRRSPNALWIYAAFIVAALVWALWETGLDWWALVPRGGIIILLGIWLAMPWIMRQLRPGRKKLPTSRYAAPLVATLTIAIVVAVVSMFNDPHDVGGTLPTDVIAQSPNLGEKSTAGDWPDYGRTEFGQRYSPLNQINVTNVSKLEEAWRFRTGDMKGPDDVGETTYEVTPLKIGNTLYLCTPHNHAIALDATTGKEKWTFDPKVGLNGDRQHQTCRGVSYYRDAAAAANASCAQRIYLPTSDARLIALDASTARSAAHLASMVNCILNRA